MCSKDEVVEILKEDSCEFFLGLQRDIQHDGGIHRGDEYFLAGDTNETQLTVGVPLR